MSGEPPRLIGRYVVQSVLGRGAMGVILRAHDPELDRLLAIKLINRDLLDGEDAAVFISRFQREARAASRCPHPNIVAVHDFGIFDGQPYLAMEFVDGTSLQALLASGRRFTAPEVWRIASQLLDALACAHAVGIIHRDIKPANILVMADLRAKLADFGIARIDNSELTAVGEMIGTPAYMSPEQCLGTPVDIRTDLFAVGAVLYEALTGKRAFAGGGMAEVIRRVVDGSPHPLPDDIAAAYPELPAVLAQALAKNPADRFKSAGDMAQALQSALQQSPDATGRDPTFRTARLDETVVAPARAERGTGTGTGTGSAPAESISITTPPTATPASAEALEAVRLALLPYAGPIAGLLVKRAAAGGAAAEAIWQSVALHIDNDSERARFLSQGRKK